MATTIRAGSAPVATGANNTTAQSATPTLPTGTVSGDRVFIFAVGGDGTAALTISDAAWTGGVNASLGGGTYGAAVGPRRLAAWYRDYNGVWTMPSVTSPAGPAANQILACAVSVQKSAGESFGAPGAGTGSDTVSHTAFSATTAQTIAFDNTMAVLVMTGFPSTTTTASASLTATGITFAALANTVVSAGTTSGNDNAAAVWTTTVSSGSATVTATHALTLGTARTGGLVVITQGSSVAPPPNKTHVMVSDMAARSKAFRW